MDIDLFSEMLKDLILDNDEVTLPGLGMFVSELMPSTFSDKGYTINPPYRKLSFRQRWAENDTLLSEFYSKVNGTDLATATKIMSEFITGLRTTLQTKKIVVFPGLGRLRATKENAFFFIADEDLDIYPYGVGLEPVSLKTHEETSEEVAQSVAALHEIISEPIAEPAVEPITKAVNQHSEEAVPTVEPMSKESAQHSEEAVSVETAVPRTKKINCRRSVAIVLACVVCLAAFALGIFLLLAHIAPDFIDSLLYTPEELRIINY